MAARMLIAALTLTAFLVVASTPAQAASAGFCAYGVCGGAAVTTPPGAVFVQVCVNLAVGCQTVPVPNGVTPGQGNVIGCNVVPLPAETGANGVVVACV